MQAVEAAVRGHGEQGDWEAAATAALEGFGPELLGFLAATLRNEPDADDVFATLAEDVWRGLPGFGWRSSLRTWLYTLAHHALARFHRTAARGSGRAVPLSQISEVAARVRSRTLPHLRTEVKDRFSLLRAELPPADQELLILRVSRGMEWLDIARVLEQAEGGPEPPADELQRAAARLRKRFQLLRDDLRDRARAAGLIEDA